MLRLNKRAVSLIVSYVLLISIAVALSISVYAWLKFYVTPPQITECPGDIKLIIQDYGIETDSFNLTVKNKGTHTVEGYKIAVHIRENAEFAIYQVNSSGAPLTPGESMSYTYFYTDIEGVSVVNPVRLIQVSPFIIEGSEKIYCKNSVAIQRISS